MKRFPLLVTWPLAMALAACAGSPRLGDGERLAQYRAQAGEPVPGMRLRGELVGWRAVGDNALVVWTRPREAWLLGLGGPCHDLAHATAISISSNTSRVQARLDSVQPLGPMVSQVGRVGCRIMEIRPLDAAYLEQADARAPGGSASPRPAPVAPGS